MATYALLNNNIVTQIMDISDSDYPQFANQNQLLVDISSIIPTPQVGWILSGNKLVMPQNNLTPDENDLFQQSAQREFGQQLLPTLVDMVGQRNLKLAREGSSVNIVSLATQMASVKLLLETGALKTANLICSSLIASFPSHADILQYGISAITNFLSENGWN